MNKRILELAGLQLNEAWDDIKTASKEDISNIAPSQVFEWIKTGKWKVADFQKWLKARE